jgi:hypothetical protein
MVNLHGKVRDNANFTFKCSTFSQLTLLRTKHASITLIIKKIPEQYFVNIGFQIQYLKVSSLSVTVHTVISQLNINIHLRFEVRTVVTIKIIAFYGVMLCCLVMFTDISEECAASTTLKMKAACSSEMLADIYQIRQHNNSEDIHFQEHSLFRTVTNHKSKK